MSHILNPDAAGSRSIVVRWLVKPILLLALLWGGGAGAQDADNARLGTDPGVPAGAYPLSGFDNINFFSGNLNFSLPFFQAKGRGRAQTPLTLSIEHHWRIKEFYDFYGNPLFYPETDWTPEYKPVYGPGLLIARSGSDPSLWMDCSYGYGNYQKVLTRLTFTAPDGTAYELRDKLTGGQPYSYGQCWTSGTSRGTEFVTADGTAATFVSDAPIIDITSGGDDLPSGYFMLRDGTRYRIDVGFITWMRDRNGNRLTFSYDGQLRLIKVTDSLKREVTISYDVSEGGDYGVCDVISYKGFAEAERKIRVSKKPLSTILRAGSSAQTYAQLFPELAGSSTTNFDPDKVSSLWLPDGRRYKFYYNSYGELARVELPTGGAMEYDWVAGSASGHASGNVGDVLVHRRVIERRVYSDGSTPTSRMTISRPDVYGGDSVIEVDTFDGSGNRKARSKHYFYGTGLEGAVGSGGSGYARWTFGKEYKTEALDNDGVTVLRRTVTTWEQRAPVSWWTYSADIAPPNDPRITETVVTMEPTGTNLVSKQTLAYDDSVPFNNQNKVKEFDFGVGAPGPLLRETRTTFLTAASYIGTTVHLRSLATQVSVYDGDDEEEEEKVERARTTFEFDNYTPDPKHAALVNRSGISGLDSNFGSAFLTRGNVTASTNYLLVNGAVTGSFTSYAQYDIAGNVVKTIDPRGYGTEFDFSDNFGSPDGEAQTNTAPSQLGGLASFAFPKKVTNALGHVSYAQFDYYTGQAVNAKDANGVVSSSHSISDSLDRPTKVIRAVGTSVQNQTIFAYDDTARTVTTMSDLDSFEDTTPLKSQVLYDQLGRAIETRQYEGGENYIVTKQEYDALGRVYKTSNPFRPQSESPDWTLTGFDALGRVTTVTTPDNAVVTTAFSGNRVLVTDQALKRRLSESDALGRLTNVWEITASDSATESVSFPGYGTVAAGYRTRYSYDVLNSLIEVTQGNGTSGTIQTRSFVYDSLKRLTSAVNPESGIINYTYDDNGNLHTRTDARGVVATYAYDALNRNTGVNYSDLTPDTLRQYDQATKGVGRINQVSQSGTTTSATYIDSYDAMGRPLVQRQKFETGGVWSGSYQVSRAYNLAGSVTSQTYPSVHTVSYNYDAAGRLADNGSNLAFTGNLGGVTRTYSQALTYSSLGGMAKEQFGTDTPVYNQSLYNVRGQLAEIRLGTGSTSPTYRNRGSILNQYSVQCSSGSGASCNATDNNGNLTSQDVLIPFDDAVSSTTSWYQKFDYDNLNRLQRVKEYNSSNTQLWQQEYDFDRWGNRKVHQTNTWGPSSGPIIPKPNFEVQTTTNRIYAPGDLALSESSRAMQYDAAGNLKKDTYSGAGNREYDADNRMTKAWANGQWQYYTYNADGQRVRRKIDGVETWQVYGMDGELVAEYAASGATSSPQKEYGYRNGQLLITAAPSSTSTQNVSWTNAVGVSVSGNSLTKTAADGWGNGGAASSQTMLSGDGYVEFSASTTGDSIIGLNQSDPDQGYNIDFSIHVDLGAASVWEAGVHKTNIGSYSATDRFKVSLESGVVKYRKNGSLLYTSTVTPTYPLLADTTLYKNGSTLTNVVLSGTLSSGSGVELNWLVSDQLGTPRMILDKTGWLSGVKRHDYLPFGEELFATQGGRTTGLGYSADTIRQKFTAKERDNETGLDYSINRYYSSTQGRFTSVDPENAGAYEDQPQSWNGYSYVQNSPLGFIDPKGLERCASKNADGSCAQWVGDYDGERSAEISGGIYKDGAYWNEDKSIWETKDQYESRTYDPQQQFVDEVARRTAWMETPGQIAVDLMPTPGPKIGILGALGKGIVRRGATKATINITQRGLRHVLQRHSVRGARTAGKSVFNGGEDIAGLIRDAERVAPVQQAGQTFERVVDAGRIIGTDRATGQPTSIYTVITDAAGNLKTAFPGKP